MRQAVDPHSLRVGYVLPSLDVGGMELFVVRLALAMKGRGHQPLVICTTHRGALADELEASGIPVVTTPICHSAQIFFLPAMYRLFKAERLDVVHTQTGSWTTGVLTAWAAGVRGRIHSEHGLMAATEPLKLRAFKRIALPFTRARVAVSAQLQRDLAAQLHVRADTFSVIANGVATAPAPAEAAQREVLRSSLNLAPDDIAVGVIARLEPIKGVDILLAALEHRTMPLPLRVVIAGDGNDRERLQAIVRERQLPVTFLGTRNDVAKLLTAFDLLVQPSRMEGLPLAVLEAMAAGCPVVSSSVGDIPELLNHGACGLLVPPESPRELMGAIEELAASPEQRISLTAAARHRVHSAYGFEHMVDRYESLYLAQVCRT